jgi:pyrroloquinoline-quinone synthase
MDLSEPSPHLLDHPFYQAWNRGDVTRDQLARYGAAYQTFMDAVPALWKKVFQGLKLEGDDAATAASIVEEESEHADLWEKWRVDLPEVDGHPRLNQLLDEMADMSASELAGAIHAYEVQQPDVAETKRRGLLDHYDWSEDNVTFFEEHLEEESHLAFGRHIYEEYADAEAFERGFERGAELVYHSLDDFV